MQSIQATRFPTEKLMAILNGIALFPMLKNAAPEAIEPLMLHSRLVLAEPGEHIMRRGEFDSSFYFLLKGKLQVTTQTDDSAGKTVGYIQAGEMFGALAIIRDAERSASVAVENNGRAILFAIDAAPFGELDDFSNVSLPVKLLFLRWVVDCTNARLQAYDKEFPNNDLSIELRELPPFTGKKDSLEELAFLNERADDLAELMVDWNMTLENIEDYRPPSVAPAADLLSDLERLYFG
jgi:hypothetical protein